MTQPQNKITIYSDYICPFCYIGKDRAEKLQQDLGDSVTIEWKMIEIHPEIPMKGVPREQITGAYMDEVWRNVQLLSDEDNLGVNIPDMLANSRLSFIASEYARDNGKFEEYHEALMEAYWKESLNIGNYKILEKLGEDIGLDFSEFRDYVANSGWEQKLQSNMDEAREANVMAVPSFVFNDKVVAGAIPYEKLKMAIQNEFDF